MSSQSEAEQRAAFLAFLDQLEAALKLPPKDGYQRRCSYITIEDECDAGSESESPWEIEQADIDMIRAAFAASATAAPPSRARAVAEKFVMAANVLHGIDSLLVQAGYTQDSSARHQLSIAQSMFREAERMACVRIDPLAASGKVILAATLPADAPQPASALVTDADVASLLDWLEGRASGGRALTREEAAQAIRSLAARAATLPLPATARSEPVTDTMVDRFLSWKLPENFSPDCGITFTPINHPNSWPIGTNLLTADQARAMLEYVLAATIQDAQRVAAPRGEPIHGAVKKTIDDYLYVTPPHLRDYGVLTDRIVALFHAAPFSEKQDTDWLEDELVEVMRIVAPSAQEDQITHAMLVTAIRRLMEADTEKYEALLARWQKRHGGGNQVMK